MAILKGCGIGHPHQNGIGIDKIITHYPNVIWCNWLGNRNRIGRKLRMLWKPIPGSAEWAQAVTDAKWYWAKFRPAWWNMPDFSIPQMYTEPHVFGQAKTSAQEAAAVLRQWQDETDGAPFVGPKILHNEVTGGLDWRRELCVAAAPTPIIEAFDLYGYSGSDIVRYAADCHRAVRAGEFGNASAPLWLMEVGSWGQVGSWKPTRASIRGVMDGAAFLTTVGWDLALWFSTRYDGDNGFWAHNNLVTASAALTALGAHWQGYVAGTRPVVPTYAALWEKSTARLLAEDGSPHPPPRDGGPGVGQPAMRKTE